MVPSPSLLSGLLEAAQEFPPLPPLHTQVHREPLKALLTQVSAPKCPPFSPSPYPFLTCWAPECPPPTIPVRGLSLRGSLLPHLRSTTRLSHTIQYHSKPYHTIPYKFIPYNTKPHHTIPYRTVSHLEPLAIKTLDIQCFTLTVQWRKMNSVRETTGVNI